MYVSNIIINRQLGRWLRVLGPSDDLIHNEIRVKHDVVRMRQVCDELLDKNVDAIKTSNISKYINQRYQEFEVLTSGRRVGGSIEKYAVDGLVNLDSNLLMQSRRIARRKSGITERQRRVAKEPGSRSS